MRIVDKRIARDARLFVVRLAEPAVDDDELPLRFDGVFAELCTHGHVPVDDMAVLPLDAEILQHPLAEIPALAVEIVTVVLMQSLINSTKCPKIRGFISLVFSVISTFILLIRSVILSFQTLRFPEQTAFVQTDIRSGSAE